MQQAIFDLNKTRTTAPSTDLSGLRIRDLSETATRTEVIIGPCRRRWRSVQQVRLPERLHLVTTLTLGSPVTPPPHRRGNGGGVGNPLDFTASLTEEESATLQRCGSQKSPGHLLTWRVLTAPLVGGTHMVSAGKG